jgi:Cytochrome P450
MIITKDGLSQRIPGFKEIYGNVFHNIHLTVRAIHRNPKDFPDPDRFFPERYLKENRLPYPNEKGYNTFGWGRRVCSGQALAEQGTQITIARLLWGFQFDKCKDKNGKSIDVNIFDYTNGLNWRPQPFDCVITPRNTTIVDTIRREGEQALRDVEIYNGTTKLVSK